MRESTTFTVVVILLLALLGLGSQFSSRQTAYSNRPVVGARTVGGEFVDKKILPLWIEPVSADQ